jgi:hypothetical protein
VLVPFGSYGGQNSGIPIPSLITESFRNQADQLFGFNGDEKQARTSSGWLVPDRSSTLIEFAQKVATAYSEASGPTSVVVQVEPA